MHVLLDLSTITELPRLAAKDNFLTGIWNSEDSPYVDFDQGWSALLSNLSHNHRAQMGKRLRRLRRIGQVGLEILSNPDNLHLVFEKGFENMPAACKATAGPTIIYLTAWICFNRQIPECLIR